MTSVTIQMWGNTRAVRIPKALATQIGLEPGTQVELIAAAGELRVRPLKRTRKYKLGDLLAQCKGKNPHRAVWTRPAGRERI